MLAAHEITVDLRLPEHADSPVLTDHAGNPVPLAALPGGDRRFRVHLAAGARYRLSCRSSAAPG
ncbi:hypothetical protein GCM10010442_76010 [Kitasatospora kifunensis]|uniref:Uncharacterized protein n=1 Tax=Kitasatospora kifunensis TaxID=58351 RepID=A0A7W7W009_KITKI|nr:hypothetical protein [Kitasatospora kifunensis]MBB4928678.1 hypothetical protein [Kitasatospora kifunensis]